MGTGSTTTGPRLEVTCCGTITGSTTTGNIEVTGCGTLTGSTTTNAGLKIDGVSTLGVEQRSISKELACVLMA